MGKSPFVALGASLGGILLVIVALFLIFASDKAVFLSSIAWAFVVLGIVLAFFQYKVMKK